MDQMKLTEVDAQLSRLVIGYNHLYRVECLVLGIKPGGTTILGRPHEFDVHWFKDIALEDDDVLPRLEGRMTDEGRVEIYGRTVYLVKHVSAMTNAIGATV